MIAFNFAINAFKHIYDNVGYSTSNDLHFKRDQLTFVLKHYASPLLHTGCDL